MKRDANDGSIALYEALDGYDADTAIYCLTTQLARWIVDTAKDRDEAEERLAFALDLLNERVATNIDVYEIARAARSPRVRTPKQ